MPINILKCSAIIIILFYCTLQVSSIPIEDLHFDNSEEEIRQSKANEMLRYLNESADPCEDFFEFSCGNYGKYHPTNTSTSELDAIEELMKRKLQQLLEEVDHPEDTDFDKKVKIFYGSCMKSSEIMNATVLRNIVKEFQQFGQFPILEGDNWQEHDFDWQKLLAAIQAKTGIGIIFDFFLYPQDDNTTLSYMGVCEAPFTLKDRSYYVDESITVERNKHRDNIARNLQQSLGVEKGLALQTAQEILEFEIALARGMNDEKSDDQQELKYYSREELETEYLPVCNFRQLIDDAMGSTPNRVLLQLTYIKNALEALRKTPPKIVANYIFYKYLDNFIFDYKEETINTKEKFCTETTKELFYKNLINLAYRRYFNEQSKEGIHFMWQQMKLQLHKQLQSPRLNWMEEETRQEFALKLEAMHLEILSFEQNNFTREFANLELNLQDYVQNVKSILALRGQQKRQKFSEPPESFIITYLLPFYSHMENCIKIPISIMLPHRVWSRSYPNAYNFAALGVFIAHETFHGFDNVGFDYDAQGKLKNWWDDKSAKALRNRIKCIRDQYHGYIFGDRPLGVESQSENIADNGAVRLAYSTYIEWLSNSIEIKGEEVLKGESFPGLNYTNRQLFFISYAQSLCATTNPDYMVAHAAGDVHVPEKYRVIGSLSNFEEFSKEFKCPRGSIMNPLKRCEMY